MVLRGWGHKQERHGRRFKRRWIVLDAQADPPTLSFFPRHSELRGTVIQLRTVDSLKPAAGTGVGGMDALELVVRPMKHTKRCQYTFVLPEERHDEWRSLLYSAVPSHALPEQMSHPSDRSHALPERAVDSSRTNSEGTADEASGSPHATPRGRNFPRATTWGALLWSRPAAAISRGDQSKPNLNKAASAGAKQPGASSHKTMETAATEGPGLQLWGLSKLLTRSESQDCRLSLRLSESASRRETLDFRLNPDLSGRKSEQPRNAKEAGDECERAETKDFRFNPDLAPRGDAHVPLATKVPADTVWTKMLRARNLDEMVSINHTTSMDHANGEEVKAGGATSSLEAEVVQAQRSWIAKVMSSGRLSDALGEGREGEPPNERTAKVQAAASHPPQVEETEPPPRVQALAGLFDRHAAEKAQRGPAHGGAPPRAEAVGVAVVAEDGLAESNGSAEAEAVAVAVAVEEEVEEAVEEAVVQAVEEVVVVEEEEEEEEEGEEEEEEEEGESAEALEEPAGVTATDAQAEVTGAEGPSAQERATRELLAASQAGVFGSLDLRRLEASISAAARADVGAEPIAAARRAAASEWARQLRGARAPSFFGGVDMARLAAAMDAARRGAARLGVAQLLAAELASCEAALREAEEKKKAREDAEAARLAEEAARLQVRRQEEEAAAAAAARQREDSLVLKAKMREAEVARRRREELERQAARLAANGHAANQSGDCRRARAHFLAASQLLNRPADRISAANMALKLGEALLAKAEYAALQEEQDLSPRHREVVESKLAEVALMLEAPQADVAKDGGEVAPEQSMREANATHEEAGGAAEVGQRDEGQPSIDDEARRAVEAAEEAGRLASQRRPFVWDADFDVGEIFQPAVARLATCIPRAPRADPVAPIPRKVDQIPLPPSGASPSVVEAIALPSHPKPRQGPPRMCITAAIVLLILAVLLAFFAQSAMASMPSILHERYLSLQLWTTGTIPVDRRSRQTIRVGYTVWAVHLRQMCLEAVNDSLDVML